jgi:hypothetical protein
MRLWLLIIGEAGQLTRAGSAKRVCHRVRNPRIIRGKAYYRVLSAYNPTRSGYAASGKLKRAVLDLQHYRPVGLTGARVAWFAVTTRVVS